MNKSQFSNNLIKLVTIKQARERYKLCRELLMKVAEDNNAVRRFGRAVRIDIEVLDKAIENY